MSQLYNKAHTLYATNNQKVVYNISLANYETEASINMAGCTLYLTVKTNKTDVSNLFEVNSGVLATDDGLATITIPKATMDTVLAGNYFYELSLKNTLNKSFTLTTSDFVVAQKTITTPPIPFLTGLKGWWDFSDLGTITKSSDLISQINDKSGNAKHMTASGADRPLYVANAQNSKSIARFDGTNLMTSTLDSTQVFTYFVVVKPSGSGERTIIGANGNGVPAFILDSGGNLNKLVLEKSFLTFISRSTSALNASNYSIASIDYNVSGTWVFEINGVADGTGTNLQTFTTRAIQLGNKIGVSKMIGDIGEVLIYDQVLTPTQKTQTTEYLQTKWAI